MLFRKSGEPRDRNLLFTYALKVSTCLADDVKALIMLNGHIHSQNSFRKLNIVYSTDILPSSICKQSTVSTAHGQQNIQDFCDVIPYRLVNAYRPSEES